MKERKEKVQPTNPSLRSRLDSLLFQGTRFGTTLASAAFLEPKVPPFKGE